MKIDFQDYKKIAKDIRKLILMMHAQSNSSHVGSALSIVEILTFLYFNILKNNPNHPKDEVRDRFILSKGHACSALCATLAKRGFFPKDILNGYCVDGGRLFGHATRNCVAGVEVSTGSLGHGLSMGIGMAISGRYDGRNYKVFVLLSDGECDEGAIWESAMFASHHKLDNLVAIIDYNKLQGFGRTNQVINLEPLADKWRSFGWSVKEIDGHDFRDLARTFKKLPFTRNKPSMVIAHTIKGKGVSFMENKLAWHYKSPNEEELKKALQELDFS